MDSGTIALKYAKALLIYASAHGAQERVYADAQALARSFSAYPALRRVMDNRLVSADKKLETLLLCAGGYVSPEFSNFLSFVIKQRRAEFLQAMCIDYGMLLRRSENITDVEVVTAIPLDESTLKDFERTFSGITIGRVIVHPSVDPSLIGGYVVKWDDYRLDRSVSGRLKQIEKTLTK